MVTYYLVLPVTFYGLKKNKVLKRTDFNSSGLKLQDQVKRCTSWFSTQEGAGVATRTVTTVTPIFGTFENENLTTSEKKVASKPRTGK